MRTGGLSSFFGGVGGGGGAILLVGRVSTLLHAMTVLKCLLFKNGAKSKRQKVPMSKLRPGGKTLIRSESSHSSLPLSCLRGN